MGRRYFLYLDGRRLAVSGGRRQPVLAAHCRLGHQRPHEEGFGADHPETGLDHVPTAATRNAQDAFTRRGMRYFLVNINGILIDDHPRVPLFSWVVDHPLSHAHLSQAGEWDLLGMVDAGHAEIAGYSRAPACFVPHGGPLGAVLPPTGERPIEVLFSGNININTAISPRTLLEAAPLMIQDVADMAIAAIIDGDSEPLAALMRAMQSRGIGFTDLDRASSARLLGFVIEYAQCHRRISILKKLAGFRVTVVGRLAPGVAEHLGDGLTLAGGATSRISLPLPGGPRCF